MNNERARAERSSKFGESMEESETLGCPISDNKRKPGMFLLQDTRLGVKVGQNEPFLSI